jgi:endogenous inhibitor of DNA gyrase (YacG/DUF329 family)
MTTVSRICPECGIEFETRRRDKRFCSRRCQNSWFSHRRHDAMRVSGGCSIESISLRKLYERDGGICHICGKKTDWDDYRLNANGAFIAGRHYPTRDHVVPVSKGGPHTWDNVKLACFSCNSRKGDSIIPDSSEVMHSA